MFGFLTKNVTSEELLSALCGATAISWKERGEGKNTFVAEAIGGLTIMFVKGQKKKLSAEQARELQWAVATIESWSRTGKTEDIALFDKLALAMRRKTLGASEFHEFNDALSTVGIDWLGRAGAELQALKDQFGIK